MCRILAVESVPQSSSPFVPKNLLEQFAKACESEEWNAPDKCQQKDGWGLYAVAPDYHGIAAILSDTQKLVNKEGTSHFEYQFQLTVWKIYYTSLNEIWNVAEAQLLANLLPPATQLLVHARAALNGEGILANNQPFVSDTTAFATNIAFSSLEKVNWMKRLKQEYPDWRLISKQIGAERIFHLFEEILKKEASVAAALIKLNQQLSNYAIIHGMNIVTMSDDGMAALCGTHVDQQVDPALAKYYTLHHGKATQGTKKLTVIASAPFGGLQLAPMKAGEVISTHDIVS